MGPEALVTFLFRAPPEVRTVELLGSWDNFKHKYRMHNDRRRGNGFWAGCFKFEDVIFDGQIPTFTKPRSGGLKQGGTYWYYYQLNHDVEAFDANLPTTTDCPLLPGQPLNIIEVPSELWERPERRRSDSFDVVGSLANMTAMTTLEPESKYAKPEPPPVCRVHQRCVSDLALNGRLENNPPMTAGSISSRSAALDVSSLLARASLSSKRRRVNGSMNPPATGDSLRSCLSNQAVSIFSSIAPRSRASHAPTRSSIEISRPVTRQGGSNIPAFDFGFDRPDSPVSAYEDCDDTTIVNEKQTESTPRSDSHNDNSSDGRLQPPPSPNTNNVHFNGARPATRFDFHRRSPSAAAGSHTHYTPRQPPSFASSAGLTSDDRSPLTDDGAFDHKIHSPTFSTQTLSSAGADTPFSPSAVQSRAPTAGETEPIREWQLAQAVSPDDAADRFAALAISPDTSNTTALGPAQPSQDWHTNTTTTTPSTSTTAPHNPPTRAHLSAYALPPSDVSSTSTITKLPSTVHSNTSFHSYNLTGSGISGSATGEQTGIDAADHVSLCLPAVVIEQADEGGVSMADAIFSELGYLSGSIT